MGAPERGGGSGGNVRRERERERGGGGSEGGLLTVWPWSRASFCFGQPDCAGWREAMAGVGEMGGGKWGRRGWGWGGWLGVRQPSICVLTNQSSVQKLYPSCLSSNGCATGD